MEGPPYYSVMLPTTHCNLRATSEECHCCLEPCEDLRRSSCYRWKLGSVRKVKTLSTVTWHQKHSMTIWKDRSDPPFSLKVLIVNVGLVKAFLCVSLFLCSKSSLTVVSLDV
jgi:hypothetical protein